MPGWELTHTHPTQGRTFQRPLDTTELSFLYDGLFNGTADSIQHFELSLLDNSDVRLFSVANIVKAWLSTKRRYPLAGATVRHCNGPLHLTKDTGPKASGDGSRDGDGSESASEPHFVVQEHDLSLLRPHEIVFGWVNSTEEAGRRAAAILDGPRPLSEELLVQLYVFRETERVGVVHLMLLAAHCVTDGVAGHTLARCLLDTLARDSEPVQAPLEGRLTMTVPSLELGPVRLCAFNSARRRWRRAVGAVIYQLRVAKRQGGQTLPCRLTRSTPHVAARSGRIVTLLTHTQTTAVVANCRLYDITLNNAFLPLAQVAMTRVLYRRYLYGEISDEEWAYRRRQPYISGGPLNLRPHLDKAWFEGGGGGEFMLCIDFFFYVLPFMTLGAAPGRHQHREGAPVPSFSDLLSFDRFLHRAGLVKKQVMAFFDHPLFFEIVRAGSLARAECMGLSALQWMKRVIAGDEGDVLGNTGKDDEVLSIMDMPVVWAHWGSSFGNMDLVFPSEYPLPSTHPLSPYAFAPHPVRAGYVTSPSRSPSSSSSLPTSEAYATPKIAAEHIGVHLHTRPSELYLVAATTRGRLKTTVFYDGNMFEDAIVREWLDEVKGAVLWYLGQTHRRSGRASQNGGGNGCAGLGDNHLRANL